jgi:2-polyprenyl-3-methyl-5-hydroxy-6-metoxy-1,4-benzoquinol methylase
MTSDPTLASLHSGNYGYADAHAGHTAAYLWPAVFAALDHVTSTDDRGVFVLGCGNGAFAAALAARGFSVTGVDPSEQGIALARQHARAANLHVGSAYDDLASCYGQFPAVVSLEVVEHLYAPRRYARSLYELTAPGGTVIVSTPYHGYLKNLALAIAGGFDRHFTALWDHGHIKFWSQRTLHSLLAEAGFRRIAFSRVGRIPPFAKSMIATAVREQ